MAKNHGVVITTSCTCWSVDSYKICGVYASGDLDNGVCVALGDMNVAATTKKIQGYEYNVSPATSSSKNVWLVRTPEGGSNIEMQMYGDPRYFYNEAGRPMSLCYLQPHVDHIEVDANCFANGSLPTAGGDAYVVITTGGKFATAASAPQTGATYFSVVGFKSIAVGNEFIPTVVLRCEQN